MRKRAKFINRVELKGIVVDRPSIYPLNTPDRCMAVIRLKTVFDAKGSPVEVEHRVETYNQELITNVLSKLEAGTLVYVAGYLKYIQQAMPGVAVVTSTKAPVFRLEADGPFTAQE